MCASAGMPMCAQAVEVVVVVDVTMDSSRPAPPRAFRAAGEGAVVCTSETETPPQPPGGDQYWRSWHALA